MQERLRYVPLGWSKKYEFNEPDLKMGCDTLDTWIENVAQVSTYMHMVTNLSSKMKEDLVIIIGMQYLISTHCIIFARLASFLYLFTCCSQLLFLCCTSLAHC